MTPDRIGKLRPVHTLLLNPHAEVRLSRCPKCDKLTYPRKFGLLIHVQGHGPYVQGKTCKYCSRCKMIMVQQDELEAQLALAAQQRFPAALGREYSVLGVVQTTVFKKWLQGKAGSLEELLDHVSDIRKQIGLAYSPGGWFGDDQKPPTLQPYRPQRMATIVRQQPEH